MKKDKGKYRITRKNEGTWIKCSVVNENNIVKFVGLYKDAKEWIKKQSKGKKKSIIGYADVGSHGGIFYFESGDISARYPGLYQIYRTRLTPDLVKVKIILEE